MGSYREIHLQNQGALGVGPEAPYIRRLKPPTRALHTELGRADHVLDQHRLKRVPCDTARLKTGLRRLYADSVLGWTDCSWYSLVAMWVPSRNISLGLCHSAGKGTV
jgi:hypothetical protein